MAVAGLSAGPVNDLTRDREHHTAAAGARDRASGRSPREAQTAILHSTSV
jgi:hypothetical protein